MIVFLYLDPLRPYRRHVNIIDAAIRSHKSDHVSSNKMERLGLTHVTLKNTTWRDMNGNRQLAQRIQSQDKRHGIQTITNMLAECSSRSLENYDQHIIGRIKTSDAFKQIMQLKNRRRWKFESYQKEQRAVHKLAAGVLNGIENKKDTIVAWGDGSFKPSNGHASAPKNSCSHLLVL